MSFNIPNDSNLTISSSTVARVAMKKSAAAIKMGFALIVLAYLIFAITIVRFVPGLAGGAGFMLTENDNFYGGIIPTSNESQEKAQVLIDRYASHDGSLLDNAKMAFTLNPNTAVVDVYAGPTGTLTWVKPDIVAVNGLPLPGSMPPVAVTERNPSGNPINEKEFLNNEYLGICVKGACKVGEVLLFDKEQVMGVPVFHQEAKE